MAGCALFWRVVPYFGWLFLILADCALFWLVVPYFGWLCLAYFG